MFNVTIDDKSYTYSAYDTWELEVGRYRSAYRMRLCSHSPSHVVAYYRCINTGNGYKKRLVLHREDGTRIVVARYIS